VTSADLPARRDGAGAGAARAGRYLDVPLWPWIRPPSGPHLPNRCPAGHWLRPGQLQETPNQDYGCSELVCLWTWFERDR
jgi:hypothetical protein